MSRAAGLHCEAGGSCAFDRWAGGPGAYLTTMLPLRMVPPSLIDDPSGRVMVMLAWSPDPGFPWSKKVASRVTGVRLWWGALASQFLAMTWAPGGPATM